MTDARPTEWWTGLDRGWKAVILGLLLTGAVQLWTVAPPPFG